LLIFLTGKQVQHEALVRQFPVFLLFFSAQLEHLPGAGCWPAADDKDRLQHAPAGFGGEVVLQQSLGCGSQSTAR